MITPTQGWEARILANFPSFCRAPFGQRHRELWEWRDSITAERPRPFVGLWARGGAKSSSAEMFVCDAGEHLLRPYAVYISETQEQADKHIGAIATMFESRKLGRALNAYGSSKGWRRNRLSVANGFTVDSLGFDTASRGIKLDENRPGILIFDDVDGKHDTERTTQKKIEILTDTLLPAMAPNCAVLFVQNLIHRASIATRLSGLVPENHADFLVDRIVSGPFPAIEGLKTEVRYDVDLGANRVLIVSGTATWEGQDLAACQAAIDTYGLSAFLRESQHEVLGDEGAMFRRDWFGRVLPSQVPFAAKRCRGWDMAATQDAGDWTVGLLMARAGNSFYIEDIVRGQWAPTQRNRRIKEAADGDAMRYGARQVRQQGPQDPGAAGKEAALAFETLLRGHAVKTAPVSGDKKTRAEPLADAAGARNIFLVTQGDGSDAPWAEPFLREMTAFDRGAHDDQVDAAATAFNELAAPTFELIYVSAD